MEIDAILNESKFRPPSLFEGRVIRKREIVFTKYFTQPTYAISLRPFSICADLPFVYRVFKEKYKHIDEGLMNGTMAASYLYSGASDFCRSFTCLLNNRIILGSIDIVAGLCDELSTSDFIDAGDYVLRLIVRPIKKSLRPLFVNMLTTCAEYFFLFPEIKRLYIELEANDKVIAELVVTCGFFFCEQRYSNRSVSNIFCCDRQSLVV